MVDRPQSRRLSRYLVPAAILLLAGGVLGWVHGLEVLDRAWRFLITVSAVGGAAIVLFFWYALRARWSLRTWLGIVAVAAILAAIGSQFRLEIISGDLGFRIVPRSKRTADAELPHGKDLVHAQGDASAVDPGRVTEEASDYPGFLGRDRQAMVAGLKLARDWSARPPRLLWRQKIGAGWSAFAVVGPYAVTQEQRDDEELVVCYDLMTGHIRWAHEDPGRFTSVLGGDGPRATPTIHDGKVYTVGATGQLNCLDLASGKLVWATNILKDFNLTPQEDIANVSWGRAGSPLVVDDMVVVPAGGPQSGPFVSLVGYHKDTGQRLRQGGQRQISYASPSLVTLNGVRQIVIVNEASITGHDPNTLDVLWEQEWPGHSNSDASAPQALATTADHMFVSKGYSGGASVFTVRRDADGKWSTETVWHDPGLLKTKFANVAIYDGHVYGLSDGILECADLEKGERQWKRGRYGHGQLLLVGDLLLVQAEDGQLLMIPASPKKPEEVAQIQAIEGQCWNNPALAGRLLLVRNSEEAACYELPVEEK
jgi:outer membrane protein assembly factor BamB